MDRLYIMKKFLNFFSKVTISTVLNFFSILQDSMESFARKQLDALYSPPPPKKNIYYAVFNLPKPMCQTDGKGQLHTVSGIKRVRELLLTRCKCNAKYYALRKDCQQPNFLQTRLVWHRTCRQKVFLVISMEVFRKQICQLHVQDSLEHWQQK